MTNGRLGSGGSKVGTALTLTALHALFDVITEATCPKCGSTVALYICIECPGVVWPKRKFRAS